MGFLLFQVHIQLHQQLLALLLNRARKFFEPRLHEINPQSGKALRFLEGSDEFEADGFGGRIVERAEQAGNLERSGSFQRVGQADELILA